MSVGTPDAVAYLRGRPTAERPFVPIVGTLAAAIDQVPAEAFRSNPTRLANGLQRAQRLFDLDAVCVVPDRTLLAEALGATVEWDDSADGFVPVEQPGDAGELTEPDAVTDAGRVPIVLDAADRLVTSLDDVAVFGVLPGPHTTFEAVFGVTAATDDDRMKPVRTATVELARAFGRLGVDGFLVLESPPKDEQPRDGDAVVDPAVETLEVLDNAGELFGTVLGFAPGGYANGAVESVLAETAVDAAFLETEAPGSGVAVPEEVRVGGGLTASMLEREDAEIDRVVTERVAELPSNAFLASGGEVPATVHPRTLQRVQRALENTDY